MTNEITINTNWVLPSALYNSKSIHAATENLDKKKLERFLEVKLYITQTVLNFDYNKSVPQNNIVIK